MGGPPGPPGPSVVGQRLTWSRGSDFLGPTRTSSSALVAPTLPGRTCASWSGSSGNGRALVRAREVDGPRRARVVRGTNLRNVGSRVVRRSAVGHRAAETGARSVAWPAC